MLAFAPPVTRNAKHAGQTSHSEESPEMPVVSIEMTKTDRRKL